MASQVTHKGKTADSVYIVNAGDIVSSGPTVITLGTFQATADGTGYLSGDVIIYQQEPPALPAYINTRTGLVINPDGNDIGPVGGASSAVTVSNFPATQTVDGTVVVSNHPTSIQVSNFPAINQVEGSVSIDNLPATQAVSGTVAVSNHPTSIEVSNFPTIQPVSGSISVGNFPATQLVAGTVNVGNLPATQPVSGAVEVTNFPATQTVSGTVGVGNFPAIQAVSGTVAVSNHPTTTEVSNFPATQSVSGTVSIDNLPATQTVSGTVAVSNHPTTTEVSNFPATQTIAGSVGITNFPATQAVTGTVEVSNLSATSTQYTEGDTDATITGTAILWEKAGDELSPVSAANPLPVTGSLSVSSTVALAVFRALTNGTGYSTNDIVVLRQTPPAAPEYYNATTNAVIAAPTSTDLGPIATASNVVIDSGSVTANAGTNLNTSLLALESGGNLAAIATALAGTVDVDGSVTVSNFPTTQAVSGTVAVNNYPTSFEVSNLPATQAVSGTVAVSNQPTSIDVSNFPLTQAVSGTVTVDNQPTSIDVSNFPTTQAVSGTVAVNNHPTSIEVSNLPATQAVSGTVAVSNQPTSIEVSNLPATQAISGAVTVSNLPATQAVSGTITANAGSNLNTSLLALESGGNLAAIATALAGTLDVAGSVAVSNFPGSFEISNFPATQAVSGTVAVSNQPTSLEVSNFPATQTISGAVTANAGTNLNTSALALESGGNLATIATNTAQGAAITAATMPSGGVGPIGWLSGIWLQATSLLTSVGAPADAAATSDTGSFSLIAQAKRAMLRLSNIYAVLCTGTHAGSTGDNAAASGMIPTPGAGFATFIKRYTVSYSAAISGPRNLTISDTSGNIVNVDFTTAGPGPVEIGVLAAANADVTFSLPASGTAGVVGRIRVYYTTLAVI